MGDRPERVWTQLIHHSRIPKRVYKESWRKSAVQMARQRQRDATREAARLSVSTKVEQKSSRAPSPLHHSGGRRSTVVPRRGDVGNGDHSVPLPRRSSDGSHSRRHAATHPRVLRSHTHLASGCSLVSGERRRSVAGQPCGGDDRGYCAQPSAGDQSRGGRTQRRGNRRSSQRLGGRGSPGSMVRSSNEILKRTSERAMG